MLQQQQKFPLASTRDGEERMDRQPCATGGTIPDMVKSSSSGLALKLGVRACFICEVSSWDILDVLETPLVLH